MSMAMRREAEPRMRDGQQQRIDGSAGDTLPMSCCGMHRMCVRACMDVGLSVVSALTKRAVHRMHACSTVPSTSFLKAIRFLAARARGWATPAPGTRHRQCPKHASGFSFALLMIHGRSCICIVI
jgi:hypothetical protein